MKFETLKRNRKKKFVIGLVVFIAVISTISLASTRAKYRTTQSIKIVEGTIRNYSPADLNILAIKVQNDSGDYDSSNTIPESGYVLNTTESYCTIPDGNGGVTTDTSIPMEYKDGKVYIGVNTKGTKCYLYFDVKPPTASEIILANMTTITTRSSFSSTYTYTTTGTIFTAEDDYGTSYYFAGNPTDNWVKFAGFYWRIIRINGDGTIRMIYQGTAANTTGEGTQTTTSAFNPSYDNNMYVGYMYTSGQVHGTGTASTIKGVLDPWYTSNLASYASNIATGGGATFCNDRQPGTSDSSLNGSGGTGTTKTWYGAYMRLYASGNVNNAAPSFKCTDNNDRFETSIGLITADEVSYAGGVVGSANSDYYLYTGYAYWTFSPYDFREDWYGTRVFDVHSDGSYGGSRVTNTYGVRPVINLKSDTPFVEGGTGTVSNPYVVQ